MKDWSASILLRCVSICVRVCVVECVCHDGWGYG